MPELPDVEAYRTALIRTVGDRTLHAVEVLHPFLLRSADLSPDISVGTRLTDVHRIGKRLALEFPGETYYAVHLMIAGRFKWKETPAATLPAAQGRRPGSRSPTLARFVFENGVLSLTEAGSKRRASLHVIRGSEGLARLSRGGLEVLEPSVTLEVFADRLGSENHTLKRALTDPRLFSGIGNAYSDEILFAARLSPFAMTRSLSDDEVSRLHAATVTVLREWTDRLVAEASDRFPAKVTAFREQMHVHGKFGQPCDLCETPVQRIRYAENECNYCPGCQTGGRIYADRALSRLLKGDWPRTVEELEKLAPFGP
jgi:formamidopyrimidine-DNA glycosylase